MPWLPCQFNDEHVSVNNEGHRETQLIHREAILQFGQKGVAPVNPDAVTFLVIASKLELRRFVEGVDADELQCELNRYSTEGIHVRWPVKGAEEYNRWFICTLKHSRGLFTVISFLRQPSDQPPSGEQDYRRWPVIEDRNVLTTTVVMVMKTQTPVVKATLGSQQKLHCQFNIDHKAAAITVEWHWQYRGERIKLFSHASRSGQTEGTGVDKKSLVAGDATYTLPFAKMNSEGAYICSVSVMPLFGSLDISLHIEEPPRVSLSVGPTLSLLEGEEKKVICEVENYYPLDVETVWYHQDLADVGKRVGAALPDVLDNVLLSSHKHNQDKTFSVSVFFYLQASVNNSGRQFTCSVSHKSLRVPVRKSFILTVENRMSRALTLTVGFAFGLIVVAFLIILVRKVLATWVQKNR